MSKHICTRPTALALAFINAAVKPIKAQGGKAPWTARRVAVNADREIGMVKERDNVNVSHKTYTELHAKGVL